MTPSPTKPRVQIRKHRLPTRWRGIEGEVTQANINVGHGRLLAKLIVFDTPQSLKRYWRDSLGHRLGDECFGCVNGLSRYVSKVHKDGRETNRRLEVDARFFCVIGLCRQHLTMRIISHECVHAAFAFVKRRSRSWWDSFAVSHDEEAIAYPVDEIGRGIVNVLERKNLL